MLFTSTRLLVVTATALLLSACGGADSATDVGTENEVIAEVEDVVDVQTIAVFVANGGDPYFQNKSYGYFLADEALPGFAVEVFDAGGYENIEGQIRQVEDAIQRGVAAIVLTPVDSVALCGVVKEALDAGIVVVLDDIMLKCDFKVAVGLSENSVGVGYNQCKFLAEQMGGEGGIALMKGPSGAGIAQDRAEGCLKAIAESPGIEVLDEQWGGSNIETGTTLMEDFITAYGNRLNAVYAFGSVTAMGAANAAEAAGLDPGQVYFVGIDFHPEAVKYVENGWMAGIIPAQPVYLARDAVLAAVALVNGESIGGEIGADPCCERNSYTGDDGVFDKAAMSTYDSTPAVAPADWKPNYRN